MAESGTEQTLLEWRVHLLRRYPAKAALILAVVSSAACCTYLAWGNLGYLAICISLLLISASEYLFPIHYRITDQTVYARNLASLRKLPWQRVRHCYQDASGVKISPLSTRSRLEAFRGIYLWFSENEQQVVEAVRQARPARATSEGRQ